MSGAPAVERAVAKGVSSGRGFRRGVWRVPLLLVCLLVSITAARSGESEAELKAAFLFNFAKFVEWPGARGAKSTPLVFGVLGAESVGDSLMSMVAGKSLGGRPIEVRLMSRPSELRLCDVLYVGELTTSDLTKVLAALQGSPTLTVGSNPGFAELGGIIELVPAGNRYRFAVSPRAARQAGLKLSAKLLALAEIRGND